MVAVTCGLGGCSSSTSRFDFPTFGLSRSQPAPVADNSTTQSLPPLPAESVYDQGSGAGKTYGRSYGAESESRGGAIARTDISPPSAPSSHVAYTSQSEGSSSGSPFSRGESPYAKTAGHQSRVTVGKGDTLFSIARRNGVTTSALMSANGLKSPSLRNGQELIIPDGSAGASRQASAGAYTVKKGDTPYTIAKKHHVDSKDLLAFNGLTKTSTLALGQTLKIPGSKPASPATASAEDSHGEDAGSNQAVRVRTTQISMAQGGKEQGPIRIASAATMIPLPSINPARSHAAISKPTADDADKPAAKDRSAEKDLDGVEDSGQTESVAKNDSLPDPEPMSGNSFRWPVRGRVISEFGSSPNGSHNDGINLAVPIGTSVKAAENGVVAYAGNELKGYGNLILIRHSNNWVSAYAHNDEILVKRGDKVHRGQIIGKAGKSGSVSQPQVHFELRKGSRPVDPKKYMADA